MSDKIGISELSAAVLEQLESYKEIAIDAMNAAVKDAAETVRQEIAANAPKDTGKYSRSWAAKETAHTALGVEITVHSPKRYYLAHLLEHGHAKRGGGRVQAFPHIAKAEEAGEQKLISDLESALGG